MHLVIMEECHRAYSNMRAMTLCLSQLWSNDIVHIAVGVQRTSATPQLRTLPNFSRVLPVHYNWSALLSGTLAFTKRHKIAQDPRKQRSGPAALKAIAASFGRASKLSPTQARLREVTFWRDGPQPMRVCNMSDSKAVQSQTLQNSGSRTNTDDIHDILASRH